ncbi:MAG: hypothetical protein RMJ87_06345 [Cytophagales bacterium]|nr:hypothetical protein [Bernardetiaceae bacterium]MDW8204631.1 hypothetical protein [Cytophagales bacterium]
MLYTGQLTKGHSAMGSGLWLLFLSAMFVLTFTGITVASAWHGTFAWIHARARALFMSSSGLVDRHQRDSSFRSESGTC